MYNELDYPNVENIPSMFSITYRFMDMGIPGRINSISRNIYLKEQEKAKSQFEAASTILIGQLREEVKSLVDHFHERLTNEPGEKPKAFKNATIEAVQNWADSYLSGRGNVIIDDALRPVVQELSMLTSVSPKDLRKDEGLREHVHQRLGEVKDKLTQMIIDRPKRRIILE
jgi:hypothetical protein